MPCPSTANPFICHTVVFLIPPLLAQREGGSWGALHAEPGPPTVSCIGRGGVKQTVVAQRVGLVPKIRTCPPKRNLGTQRCTSQPLLFNLCVVQATQPVGTVTFSRRNHFGTNAGVAIRGHFLVECSQSAVCRRPILVHLSTDTWSAFADCMSGPLSPLVVVCPNTSTWLLDHWCNEGISVFFRGIHAGHSQILLSTK